MIALLSLEHSTAIVWSDQDGDTESVDWEACETDRLFTFEVAETNEQEEKAVALPGFQVLSHSSLKCLVSDSLKMNSRYISPFKFEGSSGCPIDPAALAPCLLPGETKQGFLTVSYLPRQTRSEDFDELILSRASLRRLLWAP